MKDRARARKREPAERLRSEEPDAAFDNWLHDRLKSMYQSVLNEPVPDDMLELLRSGRKGRSRSKAQE